MMYLSMLQAKQNKYIGKPSEKKYCKKRDIVPLSNDPYHPPCKRDILIRDKIDFICPPTLLIELVTFLQKKIVFPNIFPIILILKKLESKEFSIPLIITSDTVLDIT